MDRMLPEKSSVWVVRLSLVLFVGCSQMEERPLASDRVQANPATKAVMPLDALGRGLVALTGYRTDGDDADHAAPVAGELQETNGPPLIRRIPPVELETPPPAIRRLPKIRALPPVGGELSPAAEAAVVPDPPLIEVIPLGDAHGAATLRERPEILPMRRLPAVSLSGDSSETTGPVPPLQRWAAAVDEMASVEQQARTAIQQGYAMAGKGALYASRAEFIEALRAIAGSLDAHYADSQHTTALLAGLQALKEADDFDASGGRVEAAIDVAATAAAHRTRIALDQGESTLSPVMAMQRYHAYAQQQLALATGGSAAGAEALFALGKVYMAFGQPSNTAERMYGPKAITFLSAALSVDPRHVLAANELGVLYARFGKWQEARDALQQCVSYRALPEAWQNLATVHEHLGERVLADQARQEAQVASSRSPVRAATNAMVRWVDPRTFTQDDAEHSVPAEPDAPAAHRTATRPLPRFLWPW